MKHRAPVIAIFGGIVAAYLFREDLSPPLPVIMMTMVLTFVLAAAWLFRGRLAALPRFMLLVYTLPFAGLVAMSFIEQFEWWQTPAAIQLIAQDQLMRDIALTGLVGLFGLIAGLAYGRRDGWIAATPAKDEADALAMPWFVVLLAAALLFSALSASDQSILDTGYSTDALEAATKGDALASAFVLSYVLLALLYIDIERDSDASRSRLKRYALWTVVGFIVIFLQLLRGDRECSGLLVAMAALYLTRPAGRTFAEQTKVEFARLRRLGPAAALVVCVFLALGQLRYAAVDQSRANAGVVASVVNEVAGGGTWTAVLLGNLGLVAEYRAGMDYLNGETYVDYALAIPPRFVGEALGIERKLATESAPGLWYYPLQAGGVHPVVVPFKNFGVWGVLIVLALYGFVIAAADRCAHGRSVARRLLYATFFSGSLQWFWYGDMPFIRILMSYVIARYAYALLTKKRVPVSIIADGPPTVS